MKKIMSFSTSQYELRHQKSPLTANNILQDSFSILGGIFLHPLVFAVSQRLSRQVVDHKHLRVGRVNYLRNYHLTYCNSKILQGLGMLPSAPKPELTAPHLGSKAQSCQHCRYAAKLIVLFWSCWKENSWRESLHEPSFLLLLMQFGYLMRTSNAHTDILSTKTINTGTKGCYI